jgi:hypothetical protein
MKTALIFALLVTACGTPTAEDLQADASTSEQSATSPCPAGEVLTTATAWSNDYTTATGSTGCYQELFDEPTAYCASATQRPGLSCDPAKAYLICLNGNGYMRAFYYTTTTTTTPWTECPAGYTKA